VAETQGEKAKAKNKEQVYELKTIGNKIRKREIDFFEKSNKA
jgi:hypothetical protein